MPSELSYRPHYHRDWVSSSTIRAMTLASQAIFMNLLDVQWEDGEVYTDPKLLQRLVGASDAEWADFAPFLDKCFPLVGDGRQNERCAEERLTALRRLQQYRENASRGGRPSKPKANQTESERTGEEEPTGKPNGNLAVNPLDNQAPNLTETYTNSNSNTGERETFSGGAREEDLRDGAPPWWDLTDDDTARYIAIGIRESKRYETTQVSESAIMDLLDRVRGGLKVEGREFNGDDLIRHTVDSFKEAAESAKERKYSNPVATLKDWMLRKEAEWRPILRQRWIDSDRGQGKPSARRGRETIEEANARVKRELANVH